MSSSLAYIIAQNSVHLIDRASKASQRHVFGVLKWCCRPWLSRDPHNVDGSSCQRPIRPRICDPQSAIGCLSMSECGVSYQSVAPMSHSCSSSLSDISKTGRRLIKASPQDVIFLFCFFLVLPSNCRLDFRSCCGDGRPPACRVLISYWICPSFGTDFPSLPSLLFPTPLGAVFQKPSTTTIFLMRNPKRLCVRFSTYEAREKSIRVKKFPNLCRQISKGFATRYVKTYAKNSRPERSFELNFF